MTLDKISLVDTYKDQEPISSPELDDWLNTAIASKVDSLSFRPQTAKDFDPDSSINLSRFGFQKPDDIRKFLLTPAGDTIKGEMAEKVAEEEAIRAEQQLEQQEEAKRSQTLKVVLLLWLLDKDSHAADNLRELIDEQNTKAINQSKHTTDPTNQQNQSQAKLQDTLARYDSAVRQYQDQHNELDLIGQDLDDQLNSLQQQQQALINKHDIYNDTLEKIDNDSAQFENATIQNIDNRISELDNEINAQTEEITKLMDSGNPEDEERARVLINQQTGLNTQLANLHDLRAVTNNEKIFLDEDGQPVTSQKDAAFVVGKDQQIVKKDGEYYLLAAGKNLSDLTDDEKAQAATNAQKAMSVKNTIKNTMKLEKEFHNFDQKITDVSSKQDENRETQRTLQNQIKLLQSVRASLNQPNNDFDNSPKPTPTLSGKAAALATMPPPSPAIITFTRSLIPFLNNKDKTISSKQLFNKADKEHPKDAKEIKDYLKKAFLLLGIGKIPSMAPLPQTTMDSLLKNMARFGANPYKPGVTPLHSPLDSPTPTSFLNMKPQPSDQPTTAPTNKVVPQGTPTPKQDKKDQEELPVFNPTPFNATLDK